MSDRFQLASLRGIAEDALAHACAIQPALRVENLRTEFRYELTQRRHSRCYDVASDLIGVEHWHAQLREQLRDRGLAAGDATGERDQQGRFVRGASHRTDDTPAKCRYEVTS